MKERFDEEEYRQFRKQLNSKVWDLDPPHSALVEFIDLLAPHPSALITPEPPKPVIFIPRCGPSLDPHALLDLGYSVKTCEQNQHTIKNIFVELGDEAKIIVEKHNGHDIDVYCLGDFKLYDCDVFELEDIGKPTAIFDRAALVTVTPSERPAYIASMLKIAQGAPMLMIDYEQTNDYVPEETVPLQLLKEYYSDQYRIESLSRTLIQEDLILAAYLLTSLHG